VVANPPDAYAILLESVSARYDPVGFADLREKPHTPLLKFFVEA